MQSLKYKDFQLKAVLEGNDSDFCVVTETWINPANPADEAWQSATILNRDGYKFAVKGRTAKKAGGGVALVCKEHQWKSVKIDETPRSFEVAAWTIQVKGQHPITLWAIYRPPTCKGASLNVFITEFLDLMERHVMYYPNSVLLGDFNLHINDAEDVDAVQFTDTCEVLGLDQHIWFFTHKLGNILDHIYTQPTDKMQLMNITQGDFLSDHCIIKFMLNGKKPKPVMQEMESRKIQTINHQELSTHLMGLIHALAPREENNLDRLAANTANIITTLLDIHAPIIKKTHLARRRQPWMSLTVRKLRQGARKAERVWKRNPTEINWKMLKWAQKDYKYTLRAEKRRCMTEEIYKVKNNSVQLYRKVKQFMGTQRTNPLPPTQDRKQQANVFGEFFKSKIEKIRESIPTAENFNPPEAPRSKQFLSKFTEVTPNRLKKAVFSLATKGCELDLWPTALVKSLLDHLAGILIPLFNLSLSSGEFIKDWKNGLVRPFIKIANILEMSNYRPVINLSFLAKVLEKLVMDDILPHVASELPDYQSAYRDNYSCEKLLVKLQDDLLWAMEVQDITQLTSMDMSAAFDIIDHQLLEQILYKTFHISDKVLNWIMTYVKGRTFQVVIESTCSDVFATSCGVPQGSCLGPVLFTLYVSTLKRHITPDLSLLGYADDHSSYQSFPYGNAEEVKKMKDTMRTGFRQVTEWAVTHKLKLNPTKTEVIFIGSRRQLQKYETQQPVDLGEVDIIPKNCVKYLGVHIDAQLTMRQQVTGTCRKAMLNLMRIRLLHSNLDENATRILVQSLVLSHSDYRNSLYVNIPDHLLMRLQ